MSNSTETFISLNGMIREHAEQASDWRHNKAGRVAYTIVDAINKNLFKSELPEVVVGFDSTGRLRSLDGAYHWEGDNVSLYHHIDLRDDLGKLQTVLALLHNMTHLRDETYGSKASGYHSQDFQKRMKTFGVVVDKSGHVTGFVAAKWEATCKAIKVGPFKQTVIDKMLKAYAKEKVGGGMVAEDPIVEPVDLSDDETVEAMESGGWGLEGKAKSPAKKHYKYTCGCTQIYSAPVSLEANCLKCGNTFKVK